MFKIPLLPTHLRRTRALPLDSGKTTAWFPQNSCSKKVRTTKQAGVRRFRALEVQRALVFGTPLVMWMRHNTQTSKLSRRLNKCKLRLAETGRAFVEQSGGDPSDYAGSRRISMGIRRRPAEIHESREKTGDIGEIREMFKYVANEVFIYLWFHNCVCQSDVYISTAQTSLKNHSNSTQHHSTFTQFPLNITQNSLKFTQTSVTSNENNGQLHK